jgi:hypothetical protein
MLDTAELDLLQKMEGLRDVDGLPFKSGKYVVAVHKKNPQGWGAGRLETVERRTDWRTAQRWCIGDVYYAIVTPCEVGSRTYSFLSFSRDRKKASILPPTKHSWFDQTVVELAPILRRQS